ncbi:MAG: SpoIIE family protein phosphatase, partial [Oscillospiraceae bacterium]|nr:SpoIIE family protein phosphatase [Oscillospiraceae bacterium]
VRPCYKVISGRKGAAFDAAMLIALQHSPCDISTFYDAQVKQHESWCGLFGPSLECVHGKAGLVELKKGYYAFRAFAELARLGMEALTVYCAADPAAPRIHICLRQEPTPQQLSRLASALSPTVGSTLQPSAAQKTPRGWTVTLRAAPRYSLQTAAAQHSASRAACGDVYTVFQNEEDARSHLLLCDGMGSGSSAAQDGALSCSLLCRLLANGFDVYAAARLINAVFSLRQDTEAACTLDLFSFDSISGEGQLLKAGAAASYLLQQGAVQRFAGRTLPVGILDKVFCAKQTLQLQPGDILLLVSDGLDDHADTVARLLKQHSTSPLDVLCRDVLKAVKEHGLRDDATVLAARVCERA